MGGGRGILVAESFTLLDANHALRALALDMAAAACACAIYIPSAGRPCRAGRCFGADLAWQAI